MRIAFDCDGVLTNLQDFEIKYGKEYFENKGKDVSINKSQLDFSKLFNCTKEEAASFWIKYIWRYCLRSKSKDGMSSMIRQLKEDGNEIYIITARVHTTETGVIGSLFRKMQKSWLKKEKIPYDKIIFVDDNNSALEKVDACIENEIDIIVDDQPSNIRALEQVTKVVFIEEPYNNTDEYQNAISVSDVNGIYNEITSDSLYKRGIKNEMR